MIFRHINLSLIRKNAQNFFLVFFLFWESLVPDKDSTIIVFEWLPDCVFPRNPFNLLNDKWK